MCYNKLALKVAHNLIKLMLKLVSYAPVAQPDRVTGYEPVGRGFESLPARDNCMAVGEEFKFSRLFAKQLGLFLCLRNCFLRIIL